jgi:phage shock protein PspC (stress-responsive transcriptional regulator)
MFVMMEFLNKFKSRKFLTCVAGVVMGICMIFGLDTSAVNTVAGAVTALGSIATYIYSEGKIDAAAVSGIKDAVETIIEIEE